MELKITARNFALGEALQSFAHERFDRLTRFSHHIINAHLILEKDKTLDAVELTIAIKKGFLRADQRTNDMYQGIGDVFSKVEKQLKKHEEKLRERKRLAYKRKDNL